MSMTRTLFDLASDARVTFVHSARTPADHLIAELTGMAAVSATAVGGLARRWDSPGYRGRLSPAMLRDIAPDLATGEAFACGPDGYMESVRAMLGEAGLDPQRYHEESFTFEKLAGAPGAAEPDGPGPGAAFSVEFARSGRTVACKPGTFILDAALLAGLTLPSSCGEGMRDVSARST